MRLLLDANVGRTIATGLARGGNDVVRVVDLSPEMTDHAILALAVEEQRVLVTFDSDFGELIYRDRAEQPPAIVYVRFQPTDVSELLPRLMWLCDQSSLLGHMIVMGPEHTRRRAFPGKAANDD